VANSKTGLRVIARDGRGQVKLLLPGELESERGIEVDCPEHVTVRRRGANIEHLYLLASVRPSDRPTAWRRDGDSLCYQMDLPHQVHLSARITLEADGILVHYDFVNRGPQAFDMLQAPTCTKLYSIFHDPRMERTYVYRDTGFGLLAAEWPERLTEPLDRWLPCRCLIPYTGPIAPQRTVLKEDGITWHNGSKRVTIPMIATVSNDGRWVAATCTRGDSGNVWTNPDLTCQHTDPVTTLSPHGKVAIITRTFVLHGSLQDALARVKQYRSARG
jgi:hypothetical protein